MRRVCLVQKNIRKYASRYLLSSGNKTQHPTIDQNEEGTGLICHSTSNEGLSSARGAVQQDSSWGLHTNGPKQLGVTQCEFHDLEEGGK